MEKRIAVISAILEGPGEVQDRFNSIVSGYKKIIKGRMGIPFEEEDISVIAITVLGTLDQISSLTGKLGNLPNVSIKTSISKRVL
ncbi:MAG: iron-only hydrogenase system regulator [Clostridiales bacterium]|nr:iron-only hydrogenase system regulator [Clostridiales bacterium]